MLINFYKYQGAGNDFVIIDDRDNQFDHTNHQLVKFLCDRRFGIGGDGLMLLRSREGYDFEMVYFNADGNEGSMCGNGGRCIVAFAHDLGVIKDSCYFIAVDGPHEANLIKEKEWISLKMIPVVSIEKDKDYFLNTGSPHYVVNVESGLDQFDVVASGKSIRYNDRFKAEGTNVNFVEWNDEKLKIRTYERGVEDETLACGTGVTAAVLAMHDNGIVKNNFCDVKAMGGDLRVTFEKSELGYDNIWLQGPAKFVFKGVINIG